MNDDVLTPPPPATGTGASDEQLVGAVRRGDDRAFEELYRRYHRRIAAYVYGMAGDHGRAEDITQEVFLSALRRIRATERPIAFKAWVYEIAKNACIDQFRRSRRAEEVSFDADDGLAPADHSRLVATGPTPDAAVDTKQRLSHLCGAFGGLSDAHHEILVLRELEGRSYRQIGEQMGLSRPAVESTLFRARRRLTEEYEDLASGRRCTRIQAIIANAAESDLGVRDLRRLARHISHCQPCRREATAAGMDTATLRRPARERVASRVAALFPFPAVLRRRGDAGGADAGGSAAHGLLAPLNALAPVADPLAAGWGKVLAAAATVALAGAGAGAVTEASDSEPHAAKAAAVALDHDASTARERRAGRASEPGARDRARTARRSGHDRRASQRRGARGAERSGGGTPAGTDRDRTDGAAGGERATAPAASAPASSAPAPASAPASGQTLPSAPAPAPSPAESVADAVDVQRPASAPRVSPTVEAVSAPVQETVGSVESQVQETVSGAGSLLGG